MKMEKTKCEWISSLLDRQENAESNLDECGKLLEQEKEVLESYVNDPKLMKSREMANILLYDPCFVLELLNGGVNDFYFNSSLRWEECGKVLSDLLVLDNQIPFSILRKLYCRLFGETDDAIPTLALKFFGFDVPDRSRLSDDTKKASNFVELVHSYISWDLKVGQESNHIILDVRPVQQQDDSQESNYLISEINGTKHVQLDLCATMLRAAGVKINPLDSYKELQPLAIGIRFNKSTRTLDIPALFIAETTKARWLNLIAWEHYKMRTHRTSETSICKCSAAALFYNALICCESDVQLLKHKGIILDNLGMSNKDLVTFFPSIKGGIEQYKIDSRYKIFDVLNKDYSRQITLIPLRFWHYLTGSPREALRDLHNFLKRGYNYAAALITILSILQTIYAVLSYHHPKK